MDAQSQNDNSIRYIHQESASFKSQFLQTLMNVVGKKKIIEKNITTAKFSSEPANPSKSLLSNFNVQVSEISRHKVWTLDSKEIGSKKTILYIHGGGYISNLTKYDWDFIYELLIKTKSKLVVPDYPLAPVSNYNDVYNYFETIYQKLLSETSNQNIIFMGNSAGGGFALSYAQKLRNENKPQPSQIIVISPWLDITMSNPNIIKIDKKDKYLGVKGLQMAGQLYADGLDSKDYRLSPIYGDFSGLGKISLFIGTHDLFLADSRRLYKCLVIKKIPINYFEYPKMFHVWPVVTLLKESQHAIEQIALLLNNQK